jgi:hypothetical protein
VGQLTAVNQITSTFWGENYPRLLKIKREIDPSDDVF